MTTGKLDAEFIRTRRVELGMSRRALARRLAVSMTVVLRLEEGSRDHNISLRLLANLAERLGCRITDLITEDSDGPAATAATDDVKVEAILVDAGQAVFRDDIACGLGWDLDRTTAAIERLSARLHGTGQQLHSYRVGWWRIIATPAALTKTERIGATRARLSDGGMILSQARAVLAVIRYSESRTAPDRRAAVKSLELAQARHLISAGIIDITSTGPKLNTDAEFSLGLTAKRDRRPTHRELRAMRPRREFPAPRY